MVAFVVQRLGAFASNLGPEGADLLGTCCVLRDAEAGTAPARTQSASAVLLALVAGGAFGIALVVPDTAWRTASAAVFLVAGVGLCAFVLNDLGLTEQAIALIGALRSK